MKIDFFHTKIFTILLSIFYILGLGAIFFHCEILFSLLTLIVLILLTFFSKFEKRKIIILYLIFFFGVIRAIGALKSNNFIDEINSNNAVIKGRVVSSKNIITKNNKIKFYVEPSEIEVYGKKFDNLDFKVLVSFDIKNDIDKKVAIGDFVELNGKMRTPFASSNPYQFDYKKYLLNNDCKFILYNDNPQYKKIKSTKLSKNLVEDWYFILRQFEITREKILLKHSKNIKSPRLEILGGIVFGNETINPDDEVKESFRCSGLLHLLAASGLNVALIYGIWWWIANLIKFPYNLSIGLGAIFVIFYTFMTGFPPSILRASLMLLFVLFGKLIDRKADSIALIFFVAFLILCFSPKMLFDIGFQLSFAVTVGLVSCVPILISKFEKTDKRFKEKYKKLSRFKKYIFFLFSPLNIASVVAVPLVAQLWVIPLQMHYFNNLAPYSLFANIAVVPFIGVLSFIGFVSSIVALIPVLAEPVVYVFDLAANPLLALLIKISAFFSSFKTSLITTAGFDTIRIFSFWVLVSLFFLNLKNDFKNKKQVIVFSICLIFFLSGFIKFEYLKHNLEITMFDVGNADCFLIKTPKNKYFLIDTGKKTYRGSTSAKSIVNPYLKNKRIKKLDSMVITHFDSDHSGGAIDILENIKVDKIYIQKEQSKSKLSDDILTYLKENKLNYEVANNNSIIYTEPDLTLKAFKAQIDSSNINSDKLENETSIITLLTYKNKNILFMADSGLLGFNHIEKYLPQKIDIIKLGHHGALDVIDKKMVDRLKPHYALISVGINKFNHPNPKTIRLLNEKDIKTLLSKDWGFSKVEIDSKAQNIKFYHFNKDNKKIEPVLFDKEIEINFNETTWFLEKFSR